MTQFSAIILAAGRGTRMKSALPKPLHKLAHKPMLGYVIDAYREAGAAEIIVVISPEDALTPALFPDVKTVIQTEQKGTGHAALTGLKGLTKTVEKVIVALGDQPFVAPATIEKVIAQKDAVTVVAMRPEDPARYGRLVTDSAGALLRIVEYKDATETERKINLCNAYPICIEGKNALTMVEKIKANNAASEYYFTDIVTIANELGYRCGFFEADVTEAAAANTREELAALELIVQNKLRLMHMLNGATLVDPTTVYFAHDTQLGQDVVVEPNVVFGPGVKIANNTTIKAFSYLEGVSIASNAEIGPYARIRPGTILEENTKVGSFVEVKKSTLGQGSKIPHLSYVGDAVIGRHSNIGGGTVTCNYDGFDKHITTIGDDVLIGAQNALIAPVTIGDRAMTGAGSVITDNVPADALGLGRAKQVIKEMWAHLFRQKKQNNKNKTAA